MECGSLLPPSNAEALLQPSKGSVPCGEWRLNLRARSRPYWLTNRTSSGRSPVKCGSKLPLYKAQAELEHSKGDNSAKTLLAR